MRHRATVKTALPVLDDILQFIRRKNRLGIEEWEDFRSWAWLKLVETDYAAIRKFDGRGALRSYLAVVLGRLLLDYRVQKWGKWRPSAKAKSLGPVAVELELLIQQRGYTASEAVQTVLAKGHGGADESQLRGLVAQLPLRRKDRTFGGEWLDQLPSPNASPETEMASEEAEAARARLEEALDRVFARLTIEDRVALKMRFEQGLKLNEVARALGYEPKPFYRRFERILNRARRLLKREGVEAEVLRGIPPVFKRREFGPPGRLFSLPRRWDDPKTMEREVLDR